VLLAHQAIQGIPTEKREKAGEKDTVIQCHQGRPRESRDLSAQSFGGAHRGRVCVRVFIGVSVRACCGRLRYTM
jgi:hypothetical protein